MFKHVPERGESERLERFGVLMLRTDRDGDIRLTSTGSEPTIEPLELW